MKNLSLNAKIVFVMVIFALGSVVISGVGIKSASDLNGEIDKLIYETVPRIDIAYRVQGQYRTLAVIQRRIFMADPSRYDAINKDFDEDNAEMNKLIEQALSIASPEGKKLFGEIQQNYNKWWETSLESRKFLAAGDRANAERVNNALAPLRAEGEEILSKVIQINNDRMQATQRETDELYAYVRNILIGISIASILIASLLAFFILRSLSKAIHSVIDVLQRTALQVGAASQQVASSSEQLSQASTEQAASLEETAASVEEMNSMVNKNAENANASAATVSRSQEMVSKGQEVIKKMIQSMEAINRSSEGMAETVAVIEQIDKETKVINEIVNKTELLSFNASVEAARAGEHGKGFAVVAEEVGNLARMSGVAAEKIATLLEESIRKVNQMVQETKHNVTTGSEVTRECGQVFDRIVEDVSKVSGMATEIASASQEQARGIAEITKAMNQLDQMTQQNAATSEECASAAEELSAQAGALKTAVGELVVTVLGSNAATSELSSPVQSQPKAKTPSTEAVSNVVKLREVAHVATPATPAAAPTATIRRAANGGGSDIPDYDSAGFEEV